MKKTFLVTAVIVFIALVFPANARFGETRCGQEVTSGIVRALRWKLPEELLNLGLVWLTSSSANTTCPSIGGPLLILVTCIL